MFKTLYRWTRPLRIWWGVKFTKCDFCGKQLRSHKHDVYYGIPSASESNEGVTRPKNNSVCWKCYTLYKG